MVDTLPKKSKLTFEEGKDRKSKSGLYRKTQTFAGGLSRHKKLVNPMNFSPNQNDSSLVLSDPVSGQRGKSLGKKSIGMFASVDFTSHESDKPTGTGKKAMFSSFRKPQNTFESLSKTKVSSPDDSLMPSRNT